VSISSNPFTINEHTKQLFKHHDRFSPIKVQPKLNRQTEMQRFISMEWSNGWLKVSNQRWDEILSKQVIIREFLFKNFKEPQRIWKRCSCMYGIKAIKKLIINAIWQKLKNLKGSWHKKWSKVPSSQKKSLKKMSNL